MSTSKLLCCAALIGSLAGPAAARAMGTGDVMLMEIVSAYDHELLARGGWENPYLPSAAAGDPLATAEVGDGVTVSGPALDSADRVLMTEVADYTRQALDRGGWENPLLPEVALGNALASIAVGEGVTSAAGEEEEGAAGQEPAPSER